MLSPESSRGSSGRKQRGLLSPAVGDLIDGQRIAGAGLHHDCGVVYWYDPWTNRCESADATDTVAGLQVKVHILPLQLRVLVLGEPPADAALYAAPAPDAASSGPA